MKHFLITTWLTILCFLLFSNVYAWEMPSCVRVSGGSRMWFSTLQGDLIQSDHTKLDLTENLGLKRDDLVWSFFASTRIKNVHVLRVRAEPYSVYEQSGGDSSLRVKDARLGYDCDFYMAPQVLFGVNFDLDILSVDTRVRNVVVANASFSYNDASTKGSPEPGVARYLLSRHDRNIAATDRVGPC